MKKKILKTKDKNTKGRADDDTSEDSDHEPKRFWE